MSNDAVPVELVGVRIELPTNQPIVLLREATGTRYLPIWIGADVATAIAFALEGVEPQRPLTHDLLKISVEALGALVVSSRPSDAIALAARTSAPIFVSARVLEEAGVEIRDEDEEEEIARFRSFLDDVEPEDFDTA